MLMFDEEKMKELEERDKKLEEETNRYIVILKTKPTRGIRSTIESSELNNYGKIKYLHAIINAVTMEAIPGRGPQLASFKNPDIDKIVKDRRMKIMLDVSVPLIQVPKVWAEGKNRGRNITIAIIDTGVDPNHPDLIGRVTKTKDFTGEGYFDGYGHGTHVAGIIAGDGKASKGKYTGIAPEARIVAVKVLDSYGSGWMSDVIAGIEWAAEQGPHVMNLSLGSSGPCDGTDPTCKACDAIVDAGTTVCVAGGNSGPDPMTIGSPGCAKKVITVGASTDQDKIASFSSRGPTSDDRVKPDVCFPGVGIVAARAKNTSMGSPVGTHYTSASGTSMATPHAVGLSALLIRESMVKGTRVLNPSQVKDLILNHAHDLGYDNNTDGHGRGDAYESWKEIGKDDESPGFHLSTLQIVFIAVAVIFIVAIIIILLLIFLNA